MDAVEEREESERRVNDGSGRDMHEDVEDNVEKDEPTGTILTTIFGLSNNIVGAGILALPWCFKEASIVEGIFLMAWVGFLSGMSLILVAVCCELTRTFSFREMGERTLGPKFGIALQSIMFIYTYFSCVSFMILAGDFLSGKNGIPSDLCGDDCSAAWVVNLFNSRFGAVLILTLTVLGPLSCLRDLTALRFTSLLSIFGMFYLLFLLILEYVNADDLPSADTIHIATPRIGIFSAAPIVNVAFIAHYNVPRFYQEMQDRSIKKFSTAVAISICMCGAVYIAVGIFGYLHLGDKVTGDILKDLQETEKGAVFGLGRAAMACVVIFTYPLAFNSLRISALALVKIWRPTFNAERSNQHYLALTFLLIGLTFILGSTLDNIGVVLDYKGAVLGGCIGFAFPGWIFLAKADPKSVSKCCFKPVLASGEHDSIEDEDDLESLNQALLLRHSEDRYATLAAFWRKFAFMNFGWAVVSGVMGVIITTLKVIDGEYSGKH